MAQVGKLGLFVFVFDWQWLITQLSQAFKKYPAWNYIWRWKWEGTSIAMVLGNFLKLYFCKTNQA